MLCNAWSLRHLDMFPVCKYIVTYIYLRKMFIATLIFKRLNSYLLSRDFSIAVVVGWPILAIDSAGPGPTWVPTGPPRDKRGNGGAGDCDGPMRREGEPGVDTRGPRPPCRLKAELLGGPPMLIPARLVPRFDKGSTGGAGNGVNACSMPRWVRRTPGGCRGLFIKKLQLVAIARIVSDSSCEMPPLLQNNIKKI